MEKKQFQAESKRLLDLMINSIYTHREIFLRELISNASDAIDKLAYQALTDDTVGLSRSDFAIHLSTDETARTLTVSDNGIGMTREEMEEQPEVRLTRFRPDERKPGGVYETVSGIVKQIDLIARRIRLLDGTDIPMDDVLTLDGALFDVLD